MSRAGAFLFFLFLLFLCLPAVAAPPVAGSFVVNGVDAELAQARAASVPLDEGKSGYAVLLTARPAHGEILSWRSAEPAERGSFIVMMLEANGAVWVAELGHANAKTGRFGVVSELEVTGFTASADRVAGRVRTQGEQTFSEDRYSVDLQFDVALEK